MPSPRKKGGKKTIKSLKKRPSFRLLIISAIAMATVVGLYIWGSDRFIGSETAESPGAGRSAASNITPADVQKLIGRWRRPDGGYIIDIRHIDSNGDADAAYYNPRPIHVSRARATVQATSIKLFIELNDKGYPGAVYQLLYDPRKNALGGLYHQPAAGGSFDVVFLRAR